MNCQLRALEPSDLELLYAIENDEALWPCGSTTAPYSRYALQQYIATNMNDFYQDGQLRLVVCDGDEPIGLVDLFNYNAKHQRAEVGIAILPQYRGKGWGTLVLQKLEQYVRQHLHLHQLYAVTAIDNVRAQKVFENTSYEMSARFKDWISCSNGEYQDAIIWCRIL